MSYLVKVNKTDLEVKVFKGQRVVTFKDIDSVHQRPCGTASRNFKTNRKHFIEDEDYFVVKPNDFQKDEIRLSGINNRGTTFVTETGYLMLVKSFTDDLAWQVQRELVKNYFRAKEQPQENQSCTPTIKLYKGVPVVTVKDVVNQIGLSRGVIRTALKHGILNKDYWLLKGAELFRFKTIYPEFKTAKSLYVIAESGVKKLCKFLEVQSFPLIPKEQAVPAVNPAEKLTKVSKEEDYRIKYPLEVLHKLMNISKERGLDLTLRPFKACYSVLYRDTVGIQETLPIHQIIYEIAFELAHSILHKGRHVVGNQDCNKRAHQTAVSFIKTLDVLSTQ